MFLAEIGKIMYTPVNPTFTIQKWGLKGSKLYRYVFVMPEVDPFQEADSWQLPPLKVYLFLVKPSQPRLM